MLTRLEIQLNSSEIEKFSYQKAVLLQSVLMENAQPEYAERMHMQGLHPYSQAMVRRDGKNIWIVNALDEECYENLLRPLEEMEFQGFKLDHDNIHVDIIEKKKIQVDLSSFMKELYFQDASRYITLKFNTPTSFKTNGEYEIFPRMDLIYKSIISKYEVLETNDTLYSDELLEELIRRSRIVSYTLKSGRYYIGKAFVPSFTGQITIKVTGAQSLVNFVHFLLHFGEYSGVGVKTGMGMGNIEMGGERI